MKEVVASRSRLPVRDRLQPKCDLFFFIESRLVCSIPIGWMDYISSIK